MKRKIYNEEELKQVLAKKYTTWTRHIINKKEYVADSDGNLHKTETAPKERWKFIKIVREILRSPTQIYDLALFRDRENNTLVYAMRYIELNPETGKPKLISATTGKALPRRKMILPSDINTISSGLSSLPPTPTEE